MNAMTKIEAMPPAERDRRKDRLVRLPEVIERIGLSKATIYRRAEAGTFPPAERLGPRSVAWYESDLGDFIAAPSTYRAPTKQ